MSDDIGGVSKPTRGYFERDRKALHQVVDHWLERLYDEKPNSEYGSDMVLEITGSLNELESGEEYAVLLVKQTNMEPVGLGFSYGGRP